MANRNFPNGGKLYSGHVMPVAIDCNFIVDSANGNGLGLRSLKGPLVQNVFMHTTATPAAGSPAPAAGIIVVQLQDNFNRIFTGGNSIVSPLASAGTNTIVAGSAYVISSLGTTTTAQWIAAGMPKGLTPAVGLAFIAASSGAIGGTGTAGLSATSGIRSIETIGDTNAALAPFGLSAQGFGGQIILQCLNDSGALTAPADGSVISLSFLLSNSAVVTGSNGS